MSDLRFPANELEREIHNFAMANSIPFASAAMIFVILELRNLNANLTKGSRSNVNKI